MNDFEPMGYYECDDEQDEGEYDYDEYYQQSHIRYPNDSSTKKQIQMQGPGRYNQYHDGMAYYNQCFNPPLSSEDGNVSASSMEDHLGRVPLSNKFNNGLPYHPPKARNNFANPDLDVPEEEELLTITVEIGNGEKENIVIMNNDTPEEVASRFCNKYEMNDELKNIFTQQIAENIEQVRKEINGDKQGYSEGLRQEQLSTAIDNTPPPKTYQPTPQNNYYNNYQEPMSVEHSQADLFPSNRRGFNFSEQRDSSSLEGNNVKHTYTTPGPILINPNKNEKRMLGKNRRKNKKPKGMQSCTSVGNNSVRSNKPHINSHSVLLANKKRIPADSVYSRLHTEALNKQKVEKRQAEKYAESSYEACSLLNNSFNGKPSANRKGRSLVQSAHTARNRTPNNYGEKLYTNGLKKLEEKKRKHQKDMMEKELKE